MKEIVKTSINLFLLTPLESLIISVGFLVPFIWIVYSVIVAIFIARAIEGKRRSEFPDLNRFLFILFAYVPGLAASFILCLVCGNMKDTETNGGYGALGFRVIGLFAFLSQLALTIIGTIIALKAPKPEWQIPSDPNIANIDTFFNDNKEE